MFEDFDNSIDNNSNQYVIERVLKYCAPQTLQFTNKVSFAAFIMVIKQHFSPLRAVASNRQTKTLASVIGFVAA